MLWRTNPHPNTPLVFDKESVTTRRGLLRRPILYLQALSQALKSRKRAAGLDTRWTICPTGGIGNVRAFVSLFGGNKLDVAVLADQTKKDLKKLEELRKGERNTPYRPLCSPFPISRAKRNWTLKTSLSRSCSSLSSTAHMSYRRSETYARRRSMLPTRELDRLVKESRSSVQRDTRAHADVCPVILVRDDDFNTITALDISSDCNAHLAQRGRRHRSENCQLLLASGLADHR